MDRKTIWTAIYVVAAIIFFGGYFAGVYKSPYFPIFVVFCMVYGAATTIYWWRTTGR
jgi:hypothetical protein